MDGSKVYLEVGTNEVLIKDVDFIVYTKGMVPENSLQEQLNGKVELYSIGDCREVGKAMDAIHSAYDCALLV